MKDELTWRDTVLWRGRRVVGWVGRVDGYTPSIWYGRTAGTVDLPFIRGEFEIEQAARDFVMFLASTQENQ
jgi:hypothetical protein